MRKICCSRGGSDWTRVDIATEEGGSKAPGMN